MSKPFRNVLRVHVLVLTSSVLAFLGVPLLLGGGVPTALAKETPESLSHEVQSDLTAAQKLLDQVLAVQGERTVENTLEPLNEVSIQIDNAASKSSLMENVHPDADVRAAAEKGSQDAQAFATELSLNRKVYDALAAVDVSAADAMTRREMEHTLRDYRRSGVDKDEATREKIRKLREELVELGQEFDRNIRDGVRFIELDSADDLAGLPDDYVASHQPGENGKIKITTQYPDYIPFMSYAKNGEARKRLYEEYTNRAFPQNRDTLKKILEKRHELATTLGYKDWAAYITEDKMAKTPEAVSEFIEKLDAAAKPRAERDYAMLLARKRQDDPQATSVAEYEKSYYAELVKKEQFDFDSQVLRNYYDYPRVKDGILGVTSTMFGVTFKPVAAADVWDPSVECYDVYEGDKLYGRFYLDMHPREGKFSHAAQFTLRSGVEGYQMPEPVLVCNFPGGNGDEPALMEHDDVETFFHEFGHLLHAIFGGHQPWIDMSGVSTEWDFVEAPSQMLEEWSLDPKVLQTFARDYKTGEPIPADLIQKLRAARDFGNGTYVTQQNFYTAISLDIHDRPASQVDFDKLVPELQARYGNFAYVPGSHMYASFGHLEGYSAMYYTYMWSLVIAKDLFSKFDHQNLLDPTIATEYRKEVLEPGGTKDAAELVRDFLGRDYSFESFRDWLNRGAS